MKIPEVGEYWYALDKQLVKILKVNIRASEGWSALVEVVPTKKKRLIRDSNRANIEKKNIIDSQETDKRKILLGYLGENNGSES